jgi:hypothetical protein|tara:strand:+ start:56 stop:496 length:441 start_codon:yes stop_codon:yes gene_type:complete
MKKIIFTLALGLLLAVGANAQDAKNTKGDWYVGTGNIANVSWTDWSVSPTLGYGVTDNLMVGLDLSQQSDADLSMGLHARYFLNVAGEDLFIYAASTDVLNLDTPSLNIGVGKFFTFHKGVYVDPKIVFDLNEKTTNLQLGFGLKF